MRKEASCRLLLSYPKIRDPTCRSSSLLGHRRRLLHHQREHLRDAFAHIASIEDEVERSVIQEEFAALKTLGKCFSNGLLNDARTRKSDQRLRLSNVDISEHREARRDTAGRGIGED